MDHNGIILSFFSKALTIGLKCVITNLAVAISALHHCRMISKSLQKKYLVSSSFRLCYTLMRHPMKMQHRYIRHNNKGMLTEGTGSQIASLLFKHFRIIMIDLIGLKEEHSLRETGKVQCKSDAVPQL